MGFFERRDKKATLFAPVDLFVILGVLTLAALLLLVPFFADRENGERGEYFTVEYGGGEYFETYSLSLDEQYSFSVDGHTVILSVEHGEIFVLESDCPRGDCMRFGRISREGESIICAPLGLVVRIDGGGDNDAIAG